MYFIGRFGGGEIMGGAVSRQEFLCIGRDD